MIQMLAAMPTQMLKVKMYHAQDPTALQRMQMELMVQLSLMIQVKSSRLVILHPF
jgi:hypothetical protein